MRKVCIEVLVGFFALSVCGGCSAAQAWRSFSPAAEAVSAQATRSTWSAGTGRRLPPVIGAHQPRVRDLSFVQDAIARYLFASDFSTNNIYVLRAKTYGTVREISYGYPNGLWVDGTGNLYAANYPAYPSENPPPGVIEYSPGASKPSCIYSGGIDPINVTVDRSGNVYAADYNYDGSGYIDRYSQCGSSIGTKYAVGGAPQGVAVDTNGDLYVSYNSHVTGGGALEEFPAGSKKPVPLGPAFHFAGGLIFDKNGNLLACDQGSPNAKSTLDVIKPPFNQISKRYHGFRDCYHLSLAGSGKLLFVADLSAVDVLDYPSGQLVTTLAISNPAGVAFSPALVP